MASFVLTAPMAMVISPQLHYQIGRALGARPSIGVGRVASAVGPAARRADEAMPQRIVEEAQRGRWPHAAATRRARGGCGRRPRRTSSPMRCGIASSVLLVCSSQDPRARPTRILGRTPRGVPRTRRPQGDCGSDSDAGRRRPCCCRRDAGAAQCQPAPRPVLHHRPRTDAPAAETWSRRRTGRRGAGVRLQRRLQCRQCFLSSPLNY